MTKTKVLIGLLLFWFIYTLTLNTFSFIDGSPSFFDEDPKICSVKESLGGVIGGGVQCESISKLSLLLGFGTYADIPRAITWLISFGLGLVMAYFIYEALMPTK